MRVPLVSLRDISAGYDGKDALRGVSFDIYDGDFVVITGPNGGGKTTLVKVVMGLVTPTAGTIEYADTLSITSSSRQNSTHNDLRRSPSPNRSRKSALNAPNDSPTPRRIGYLPQQSVFDRSFPISVIDVVASGLQVDRGFAGRYTRSDFAAARKLLEMTDISHLADRPIGAISGGQMQRALLCRALISGPGLLVLDEPTTYVDSQFEGELYGLLRALNARPNSLISSDLASGMTILMVSHAISSVSSGLADLPCRLIRIDGYAK